MSSDIAIKVENLSKIYQIYDKPLDRLKQSLFRGKKQYFREFKALDNISFEIKKGETIGIVGKNGSGKSTLLQIIAGTLQPSSGDIWVNGKVSALLELGSGFNPEFTGRENVYLSGNIFGITEEQMNERFKKIVEFADIGDFIDQPVKTYSSGMFARLAFAVAIHVDPDILIVDEALSVGDMAFQLKCYRKFQELQEAGKTILFVTHAMDTVLRYCTRAILINEGIKIVEGEPKYVVDEYKKILAKSQSYINREEISSTDVVKPKIRWKEYFQLNKDKLEYGNGAAEICDYGIFDENGEPCTFVQSDEWVEIKMKVRLNEDILNPIFAMTIKDVKGLELAGTNTMIEDIFTGLCKRGDEFTISFKQKLNLAPGVYTLSLGCTGFEGGELKVYHRLYDILVFKVSASRSIVGIFDLNSTVTVKRMES
ncbi:MAG TPA: ABC transporter ATP-binding protein [Anoxybacillus sp.]|nr:ABC transporter ATP-binding protein [Anoxybacillus sp.]